MNQFQIYKEREQLRRLHQWLTSAALSGTLVFSAILFNIVIVITVLCLLSLGFSIYILRSLFQLNKKGWILTYAIIIGIPLIICFIPNKSDFVATALWFVPLILFYVYCWILRYSITEWLSDLGDEKAFELDKTDGKFIKGFTDQM